MFRFKQFSIRQDRAAMKVCTDACVLGAYADVGAGGHVLDIGTGTGLLALMAAQRNPTARIDAVEVDNDAVNQAIENVAASPFADRVRVIHERIQDFDPSPPAPLPKGEGRKSQVLLPSPFGRGAGGEGYYDRILTNPPFYTNHLRSPDPAVNRALHTDQLPLPELLAAVVRLMDPAGQWWVLLPPYEAGQLAGLAQAAGLWPFQKLSLRHHAQKPVFRVITGFSFEESQVREETLIIHQIGEQNGLGRTYTAEFRALLRDFYLIF